MLPAHLLPSAYQEVYKTLENNNADGSAKVLLHSLVRKPEGFKMSKRQAKTQASSGPLLEHNFAVWENGRLKLAPEYVELLS